MVLKRKDGDICSAYRPQTFSEVVGQTAIVKSLRQAVLSDNHSQCYLFQGERGCGKTTLARIVGMALNCDNRAPNGDPCCECQSCRNIMSDNHVDFREINASSKNGINDVRKIEQELKTTPLFGKVKLYLFDEAHKLSTEAQNALLKDTEDMPSGVYIILCSTEPNKIISTLRDRCEAYDFKRLPKTDIRQLLETVGVFEDYYPNPKVLDALIEASDFRPRNALKALQKAINISRGGGVSETELLELIGVDDDLDKDILDLCRLLTSTKKSSWDFIMSTYRKIKEDPEAIRLSLAGWFRSMLERSKNIQQAAIPAKALQIFVEPLPIAKPENMLVLMLYQAYLIFHAV